MQPRLTPPGERRAAVTGDKARFPWVAVSVSMLLLLALFVVIVLPSLVQPVVGTVEERPGTDSPLSFESDDSALDDAPILPRAAGEESAGKSHPSEPELNPGQGPEPAGTRSGPVAAEGGVAIEPEEFPPVPREGVRNQRREMDAGRSVPVDVAPISQAGSERPPDQGLERSYAAEMSAALGALERGDLEGAKQALDRADGAIPGSDGVREARRQLAAATISLRLQNLAIQAAQREQRGEWQSALGLYRQALQLDPSAAFARSGRQRMSDRLALEQAVDHYLGSPERLQSAIPLENAKRLLRQIDALADPGPGLRARHKRLIQLVAEAEATFEVTIRSDGATDVVIYPVGRLGRFSRRELMLRPGTYTAVGTREGFRDVRKVFVLTPGREVDISVRCEEAI